MGRRIRKFTLNAYIIYSPVNNQDWESNRDDLIAQLEAEGAGLLVLPTGLQSMVDETSGMVVVDTYTVTERREKGGWCEFEIVFVEAGQMTFSSPVIDTQSASVAAAQNMISQSQLSGDIVQSGSGSASLPSTVGSSDDDLATGGGSSSTGADDAFSGDV